MVFQQPDERSSSPAPRRKARTRPPDVTEARSRAQRAKLDTQTNERTSQAALSGASHEQTGHSSVQARCRAATTLLKKLSC